jgi:hypothetical protein
MISFKERAEFAHMVFFHAIIFCGVLCHDCGASGIVTRRTRGTSQELWYVMAAGFAFLSLDEFSEIHELIQRQGRTLVWVLVYSPIALLVACYGGYETLKRSKIYPQLPYVFGVACLVMGAGAFGAEWVGNYMPSKFWYGITLVVEEFGEMLGVSILLYGIFLYSQALEQRYSRMVEGQPPHLP